MMKSSLLVVFLGAFSTCVQATATGFEKGAVSRHGRLAVSGNAVVDQSGQPVQLKGMSLFWSQWQEHFWNADTVQWLKEYWKVTLVRAAMGVEMKGYLHNPDEEKAKLVAVVEACIAADIYVIIDWHDYNANHHLSEAKAFFGEMAEKYGAYDHVIFEVFNEPMAQRWSDEIKPYHEAMVQTIRQHSNNLIVLGTRTWAQEVDVASADPVAGWNLAYTLHFYAASHGQFLREKAKQAMARGVALFVTEWGTCEASGNGRLDFAETEAWLEFLDRHHISHANWAIEDKNESCAAIQHGTLRNLTESGRWVHNKLVGSKGVSPSIPPPPPPTHIVTSETSRTETSRTSKTSETSGTESTTAATYSTPCPHSADIAGSPCFRPASALVPTVQSPTTRAQPVPTRPAPTTTRVQPTMTITTPSNKVLFANVPYVPAPKATTTMQATTTSMEVVVKIYDHQVWPPNHSCSATRSDSCLDTQCCSEAGMQCYEKDAYWAACQASCTPGVDSRDAAAFQTPWSCKPLGKRTPAATQDEGYTLWTPSFEHTLGLLGAVLVVLGFCVNLEIRRRNSTADERPREVLSPRAHRGSGWHWPMPLLQGGDSGWNFQVPTLESLTDIPVNP